MIEVSVAIPTYNAEAVIGACLASLMLQTFPVDQTEVIVCDNGSTDNTLKLIAEHYPKVTVVSTQERGSGYARNAAIQSASGKYICSIDADCIADPQWIAEIVKAFEVTPDNVVCLGGQILPFRQHTVVERYHPAWIKQENLREQRSNLIYAETPNASFKRNVFDLVGYFDGTQGMDDTDLGIRITAAGFSIQYAPAAIVYHRNPMTIQQLYHHRRKYGIFTTRLARKHPDILGCQSQSIADRSLLWATTRRVAVDIGYKLPKSLVWGGGNKGTRFWPVLDAVVAVGNYVGAHQALREAEA